MCEKQALAEYRLSNPRGCFINSTAIDQLIDGNLSKYQVDFLTKFPFFLGPTRSTRIWQSKICYGDVQWLITNV